ncbi:sensor histidine kinase [Paenibacillus whitsoniae]|uniref:HAMP domain-containing protein n=1 Tax=Paenibacillus whitsoniae TaxID=2496558 RepID=A0A3S0I793_9BACL|nr:histidine kinase [Paenibacillus whitsoniae]RTE04341.1 HAMP domain-containing protein [Paenibacillus whitsoniae]
MRHLPRYSFYTRIQVSFLMLILLPTIFISFLSYTITQNNVKDKIQLSNQSVLKVVAMDIGKMIDDLAYASSFFVQDRQALEPLRGFRTIDGIRSSQDDSNYHQIKDFFGQINVKTMNTDLFMFIANDNDFIVESLENWTLSPQQIEESWRHIKDRVNPDNPKVLQWLGTIHDQADEQLQDNYFIARALRDPVDNRYLATLVIVISSGYFEKLFGQIPSGQLTLIDGNGDRIASGPSEASSETVLSQAEVKNEVPIPKSGWSLQYVNSKKEVTGQISRTFYISVLVAIPFFVIFLLLSFYMAKRLHRPIRRLQAGVKQFGNGNRNIRFQEDGRDEIAELGRTLNHMLDQINALIADIEQEQEQKRVLELQTLYAQIRPHFLLNTLNSIKCSLVLQDDWQHSQKIDSLMSLLRAYLKFNESSTFRLEGKLLAHYVDIMQMRSDRQMAFVFDVPEGELELELPKLLLQPIVENAIVHGFTEEGDNHCIELSVRREEGFLRVEIKDNGDGMDEEKRCMLNDWLGSSDLDSTGSSQRVGIVNVLKRMRMTYGAEASMELLANKAGGLTVRLMIPSERMTTHDESNAR